jgi:hypothetical protein
MQENPATADRYRYAFAEMPGEEVTPFLAEIPARWGRMPPLSRALVVEAGRVLVGGGLLGKGQKFHALGQKVGLIGATSTGSLTTDLDFAASLRPGLQLASPALFGYTLPNIPLSEAASHYGLTGPVYAIFAEELLLTAATEEARRWLAQQPDLALMLACAFDSHPGPNSAVSLSITFTVVS